MGSMPPPIEEPQHGPRGLNIMADSLAAAIDRSIFLACDAVVQSNDLAPAIPATDASDPCRCSYCCAAIALTP